MVDQKDEKIIDILKEHAEYTTRQIAKKVSLPPTTVHHRIQKLKKEGIIKKFTIQLDNSRIQKGFTAYILISVNLELLKQNHKTQYDLIEEIRRLVFIERADIVSGGADIVALVRVKDVGEFDKVLLGKLQLIKGVNHTQSLIVIHSQE